MDHPQRQTLMLSQRNFMSRIDTTLVPFLLLIVGAGMTIFNSSAAVCCGQDDRFARWEEDIARFEQQTSDSPVQPGGVVFVGSSSIRRWKLDEAFPGQSYTNRGFGGSTIADSTHFAERFIFPLQPAKIVLYAGDNDIAAGKNSKQVVEDFNAFVAKVRKELPGVTIIFVAIKPSLKRWELYPEMAKANAAIAERCQKDDHLIYADIATPMIGDQEQPGKDLFDDDLLHLSDKGYAIWNQVVGQAIAEQ
jgi:lysophospholipase L1-like esterase